MSGLTTTDFTSILKTRYVDPINDQVVRAHVLLDRLEKKSNYDMSGSHAHIPLIAARNPAVGSRKDSTSGGPLFPIAGKQTYANATFEIIMHYGQGSVSGAIQRKSRNSQGAFAQALDVEMAGLSKSLPDDLNRQICGIGNGRAATILGNQNASTLFACDARDNFQVKVGDRVAFADAGDGTGIDPTSGTTVVAITLGTGNTHSVELALVSSTKVTATDDALYFGGGEATGTTESLSWGSDMYGIQAIVDDANIGADEQKITEANEVHTGSITKLGGITRSSNQFWQSKVMHNPASAGTERTLTTTLLMEAYLHAISQGGATPGQIEIYMDVSTWGTLGMLQVGSRIFNDHKSTVEMGWEFIEVNGAKAFYDRDLPTGRMFFLNMEHIFLLTQGGYEMIDDDGQVLRIAAGGTRDAWSFVLARDIALAANHLKSHVLLRDLQTTMTIEGVTH